jgi:hypothetical protein
MLKSTLFLPRRNPAMLDTVDPTVFGVDGWRTGKAKTTDPILLIQTDPVEAH